MIHSKNSQEIFIGGLAGWILLFMHVSADISLYIDHKFFIPNSGID